MSTYMPIVIFLLAAAIVVTLVVAAVRARRSTRAAIVVVVAWFVAWAWAGLTLLGAIWVTVVWFAPDVYPFFDIRTQAFWPAPQPFVHTPAAELGDEIAVFGGFTHARLSASGLSLGTRTLLAAGALVGSLVTVAVAALAAVACRRLIDGRPFALQIARLSGIAAGVCLVGGAASQVLTHVGGRAALEEIIAAGAAPAGLVPAADFPLDLWPVGAAIGLAAFAVLVRYGHEFQRDSQGLV